MHHGTCVTHVPWCMSGALTLGGGKNVPGIPGACATHNFRYLVEGRWCDIVFQIKWPVLKDYMQAGGLGSVFLLTISLLVYIGGVLTTNLWLSAWSDDPYDPSPEGQGRTHFRLVIYALFGVLQSMIWLKIEIELIIDIETLKPGDDSLVAISFTVGCRFDKHRELSVWKKIGIMTIPSFRWDSRGFFMW